MSKILRITTVPISLNVLLKGQLKFMQENGLEVITASADGSEVEEIKSREGVIHHIIPFTRIMSPFQDLWCLWKIFSLIRRIKPDIVHTHTPKAGLIGMLAAWITRVPNRLHTVAGMPLMEAKGLTRFVLMSTEKITYACASKVFPNSQNLQKWIIENLMPNLNKLTIIGKGSSNGIDTNHFKCSEAIVAESKTIRQQLEISPTDIIFVFVGRLVRDKGIQELVDAFNQLRNNHVHLLLLGDYEDQREPIADDIKNEIRNNKQIHAVGFKEDIRPYLSASDIFVFPSYREGFPNVVLQACAMGLPCIVTNINGSNEIINNMKNGIIVDVKTTDQLYSAMKSLMENDDLREKFSKKVRESVMDYDQQYIWNELLREYQSLTS